MAKLNELEGQARVTSNDVSSYWSGYIAFPPNPADVRHFDIAGPGAKGIYRDQS